ncbi:MAG: PKD domain-containing protein [Bacteroidales bacterium]|nr:PKD domain-containing protein [Bacteroidales bacterium]
MKKVSSFLLSLTVIGFMVLSFSSCKKVDPPTVTIFASVDGYVVAFTATATDTDNYSWSFGDGEVGSDQNPVHTYAQSGAYTATLVVTGEGGVAEATTTVTIAASPLEMLTGGPGAANGKTWVFSPAGSEGDGIYKADVDFTFEDPIPAGILGLIGLPSEYEDEFTFNNDLSYSHDVKNDSVVCNIIYAMLNKIPFRPSAEDVIVLAPFATSAASFTFTEGTDLTLETTSDSDSENSWETTWSDATVLEIEGGEFMGIMDFTRKYFIFNISVDILQVGMFISATEGSKMNIPSHVLKMTFIPKD